MGKIHELVRHFSTGLKTLRFSLQAFEYRSESCYIRRPFHPVWMYVVSMLMEHISSFVQFGKRGKMFSILKLWQEGNKIPYCTTTCQRCPNWNPDSSGLNSYSAACLTSTEKHNQMFLCCFTIKIQSTNTCIVCYTPLKPLVFKLNHSSTNVKAALHSEMCFIYLLLPLDV